MSKCCLQTATSKYAHPRLVNCISFFHIPNNCFSKTFSYHLCLKNTHIGLTTHFTNQTHWCTSYGLLNLLLVNTSLLFFSIFPTLRVFFNFISGSLYAYSSSKVLDCVFCGLEVSISDSSYSCDILTCLLVSECLYLFNKCMTISIENIYKW